MTLNPEFRRNLWLQLSPQRLIAAPAVLLAPYLLVLQLGWPSPAVMAELWRWAFWLIVVLWGTRRAADSLAEEVAGGTWDGQRMSALGAWSMGWGKLLGGTAFVWYCGLLCLTLYAVASLALRAPEAVAWTALLLVLVGLLAQAVALAGSLVFLRRMSGARRLPVTFSQLAGLAIFLMLPVGPFLAAEWRELAGLEWFGLPAGTPGFGLASLLLFLGWALLAIHRLMRAELQFRTWPWAVAAFALFLMVYLVGFQHGLLRAVGAPAALWLATPIAVGTVLLYAALFAEAKDVVRYRWFLAALRAGDAGRALGLAPLWLPLYLILCGLVFAVLLSAEGLLAPVETPLFELPQASRWLALALLLFAARDIAFVLWLGFGSPRGRSDLAALIYLAVLYGPVSAIVAAGGTGWLLPFLLPTETGHALATVGPPLLEAAAMAALLGWRLRAAERRTRSGAKGGSGDGRA